ncbi:MAG TPA: methyltransferase domain-containing protein, partial [Gammaproteobacteria bacterium]|nr:methyltransferase domain-containing protein [Gammaproteobacteria bacterium]
ENAEAYDELQGLTFAIQNEDEAAVRKDMVKSLDLRKNFKVLELSCGTGRDSENIAAQLDKNGELFVQDLSGAMLRQCKMKLEKLTVPVEYVVGNASYLPYPDHYFDAVFSFGGLNVFEDPKRALKEMVRVTKPNGKIVVGDESLPVWLYDTEFGRTLLNANPLFKHNVPFDLIPVEARNVSVKWIIGGVYYLISFTVGEGEPKGNFDLKIPGRRGGTLRTRYHGQLEGVTEETKKLVLEAAAKNKKSIHDWLDQALRAAAEKSLT